MEGSILKHFASAVLFLRKLQHSVTTNLQKTGSMVLNTTFPHFGLYGGAPLTFDNSKPTNKNIGLL